MLAMILGSSTVLLSRIKALASTGNSMSSFYAAESGIEKTLYFDRKQIPGHGKNQGNRGLCDICNSCTNCSSCTYTPLSANGCDALTCTNCQVSYNSVFDDRTYNVIATATPSLFLSCSSDANYRNAKRSEKITATSISSSTIEQ